MITETQIVNPSLNMLFCICKVAVNYILQIQYLPLKFGALEV